MATATSGAGAWGQGPHSTARVSPPREAELSGAWASGRSSPRGGAETGETQESRGGKWRAGGEPGGDKPGHSQWVALPPTLALESDLL